jgi:hypothetical protein
MKMFRWTIIAIAAVAAAAGEIKLPPTVQATVERERQGAAVERIARQPDGKWYEIRFHLNGREDRISVDNAGVVIEYRDEFPLEMLPAPARAAVLKSTPVGRIEGVWRYVRGKAVFYKVHYTAGGTTHSIRVEPDGGVISEKEAPPR